MTIPSLATTSHRVFDSCGHSKPQVSSIPNNVDDMPTPHGFASASARAEEWDILDCGLREDGSAPRKIQRLDNLSDGISLFDDGTAWEHVIDRARTGSVLHQSALKLVDPVERVWIRFWCSAEDLLS